MSKQKADELGVKKAALYNGRKHGKSIEDTIREMLTNASSSGRSKGVDCLISSRSCLGTPESMCYNTERQGVRATAEPASTLPHRVAPSHRPALPGSHTHPRSAPHASELSRSTGCLRSQGTGPRLAPAPGASPPPGPGGPGRACRDPQL